MVPGSKTYGACSFMNIMKGRPGFTFIELFGIVAIIAVLATIAIPNFLRAQINAKVIRAYGDMKTLAMGLESYFVDHGTYPRSVYNQIYDLEDVALKIEKAWDKHQEELRTLNLTRDRENISGIPYYLDTSDIVLEPGPYQRTVKTAADEGVSSHHFAGNYEQIDWYILKEPIDYLHGMGRPFIDTFGRRRAKDIYFYYHMPSIIQDDNERNEKYLIISRGPIFQGSYFDISQEPDPFNYDPTNGTVSAGDLIIKAP